MRVAHTSTIVYLPRAALIADNRSITLAGSLPRGDGTVSPSGSRPTGPPVQRRRTMFCQQQPLFDR